MQILDDVCEGFDKGYFSPLPVAVYDATGVHDAFAHASEKTYTGCIGVKLHEADIPIAADGETEIIKPDATYIVTGGTRGLGSAASGCETGRAEVSHHAAL